ncbi:MAG: hypothetical protein ABIH25_02185 [Candidatus Woesearchaeota archaeon]
MKWVILLILLFCLFVPINVSAIGISPGSITMGFEPNFKHQIEFFAINSYDDTPFNAEIFIDGELAQYTDFEGRNITLEPGEKRGFNFNLILPSNFDRPGNHTGGIVIRQTELSDKAEGMGVGAFVAVRASILVLVPYDGPYLDAKFHSADMEKGFKVPFSVLMRSLGDEPIDYLKGTITIFDSVGDEVGDISFEDSLIINEEKEISFKWDSIGQSAGFYTANLLIEYGKNTYEANTEFKLGYYYIDILKLQNYVEEGKISEYAATILSTWNSPIEGVHVELVINYNNDRKSFKSESFSMDGWQEKAVNFFIDARNMEKGKYPAEFTVYYGDSSNSVDFDIKVKTKTDNVVYIIVALIIIVITIFIIFRKKILNKFKKRGKG